MSPLRRALLATGLVAAIAIGPAVSDCLAGADARTAARGLPIRADAGDAGAQYRLALAYQDGIFVAASAATAARLHRAAAEQGHADAQAELAARLYGEGDRAAARDWAERAARGGSIEAAYLLGRIHAHGDGAEADPAAAFRWFLHAELRGHVVAAHERRRVAPLLSADLRRSIRQELTAGE